MKIAYFDKHGMLIDVSPRTEDMPLCEDRDVAYFMDVLVLDGTSYFLGDVEQVRSIPMPQFYPTGNILELSYIFKIRCRAVDDPELIPIFISKALEFIKASSFMWQKKDYLQVIRNYYRLGLYEAGDSCEAKYRAMLPEVMAYSENDDQEGDHLSKKIYFENKNRRYKEYALLKRRYPDIVPNTVKGYLQIRTRRTKRFLEIERLAQKDNIEIDYRKHLHFCNRFEKYVEMTFTYKPTERLSLLVRCSCSGYCDSCRGIDKYGLRCTYFNENI